MSRAPRRTGRTDPAPAVGDTLPAPRAPAWSRLALALAWRSLRRPATGVALLRVAWRFRRLDWYRRFPFLPLPSRRYVRWRMHTAYGDEHAVPPAEDVERYARWAVRDE